MMSCHANCNQGRHCDGSCEPKMKILPLTWMDWAFIIFFGMFLGVLLAWRG